MIRSYRQGCRDTVQLAAGNKIVNFLGTWNLKYGKLELSNAIQVDGLHGTLISVGEICDQQKIVVFSKDEALILDTDKFRIDPSLIVSRVPRHENKL